MKRKRICGIYKIENLINHKVYIGQSVDIERRFRGHINKEHNHHLKHAFKNTELKIFLLRLLKKLKI